MNPVPHDFYRRLVLKKRVEGLSGDEREALERHMESCAECAASLQRVESVIVQLRTVPVTLPPDLAARTQMRLYLRAREGRPEGAGWALWASFVFSWVLGVASAPWIWRAFEWIGNWAGVPAVLIKVSFALWWAVPALLTAAVLLLERGKEGDSLWQDFSSR